jgi:DNA-binding MarR family transcriptional regulator
MMDTGAPDGQVAPAEPAMDEQVLDEPAKGAGRPNTAREHGVRWGDEWDDAPLDGLPMSRLAALAARLIATYWWYTAEGTGVSAAGLGVLAALDEEDGLRSGEVAARSWVTPPMVSYLADVLERDGYVIRRKDTSDRRVVHLHLTGRGREKLRDARKHVAARWQTAFGYIDPADEPVIRRFLLSTVGRFGDLIEHEQQ